MEKKHSFRIPESEAHTVMIGAKNGSDKEVELMEPIGKDKMLTVTFSQVSGWVPLLHGQTSMLQKARNMTKKKKDVQEAAKPQQKQVPHTGLPQPYAHSGPSLIVHCGCRSCSNWPERAILGRFWPSWDPPGLAKHLYFL